MKNSLKLVVFLSAAFLTACATHSGWTPTVDPGRSQSSPHHYPHGDRPDHHQPRYRQHTPPDSDTSGQYGYNRKCYKPSCQIHETSRRDYHRDLTECRQLALQSSGGTATETAKGAVIGGLIGAAGGAAIGAIAGDPGKGAAIGAAVGGIGGGAKQAIQAEDQYKHAYINCMRQRGHNVID